MRELGKLAFTFPALAEQHAPTDQLMTWRKMISEEQKRRVLMAAKAIEGHES